MITDRISLNVAQKYLNQFEQNEGRVIDILFSIRDNVSRVSRTVTFNDLYFLKTFIDKYAPLTTFEDADCSPLLLFELKKFSVIKNGTDKNLIYTDDSTFITRSNNIGQFSLETFNREYGRDWAEIRSVFNGIELNEYILNQIEYIDCGYIEIHTEISMENLKKLYNKYK
jgi:hypothetical protein